jgi:hypothetical protein
LISTKRCEHVLAERLQDQLRLRRDLDRLAERLGSSSIPSRLPLVRRQVVEVRSIGSGSS